MTIWRDVDKSYAELPVKPAGTFFWTRIFACQLGPMTIGDSLTVFGKLQGSRSNPFDVEYRIALEVFDGVPLATRTTDPSQLPRTGENVGPDTSDKYVCLVELLEHDVLSNMSDAWAVLWASSRSSMAVASSRQLLGNGYLSVRKY